MLQLLYVLQTRQGFVEYIKNICDDLERLPEFPITALHDIPVDEKCLQLLNDL